MSRDAKTKIICVSDRTINYDTENHRVIGIGWNGIDSKHNLSDTDILVLNFSALDGLIRSKQIQPDALRHLRDLGLWKRLFLAGACVYIIGRPILRWSVTSDARSGERFTSGGHFDPLGKILTLVLREQPVDSSRLKVAPGHSGRPFESWCKLAERIPYTIDAAELTGNAVDQSWRGFDHYSPIITTTPGEPVVLRLRLRPGNERWADLLLLPPISDQPAEDDDMLLAEVLGVQHSPPPPEWTRSIDIPGEQDLVLKIDALERERERINTALEEASAGREALRKWIGLLYCDGPPLATLVCNALTLLGATVDTGPEGRADFLVRYGSQLCLIVEVKGTRNKQHKSEPVRQLNTWMSDYSDEQANKSASAGPHGKGLLVLNNLRLHPIEDRPLPFAPATMRDVERNQFAVLLTQDLLAVIRAKLSGGFDSDEFWNRIGSTVGYFSANTPPSSPAAMVKESARASSGSTPAASAGSIG